MISYFEALTVDQLNSIYGYARWVLGALAVLTTLTTIFSFYVTGRISTLQKKANAEAQARLEKAESQITSAQDKADSAKERADAAEKKAGTAEAISSHLEDKARPRFLTEKQASQITGYLRNSDKYKVDIQCITNNTEAWHLAEQVKSIFEAAGYSFERIVPVITVPPLKGIKIKTRVQMSQGMDKALAELLSSQNQPLTAQRANKEDAEIIIQIGQKQ